MKLIRHWFLERKYSASLICQKCLAKNCAIPACSISRKDKGIRIFKVPPANNKFNQKWNQDFINIILKFQHRDKFLSERIESPKLFTCEKHFMGWGVHKGWSFCDTPAKKKKKKNMACSFQNIILRRRNYQHSQAALYVGPKLWTSKVINPETLIS